MIKNDLHSSDLNQRSGKLIIPYMIVVLTILGGGLLLNIMPVEATNNSQLGNIKYERLLPEGRSFQAAPLVTEQIYLPLLVKRQYPQMPNGEVSVTSGPYSCDTNQNCYDLNVVCPQVIDPTVATLRIGEPTSQPMKGTIVFFSGYDGAYYWGKFFTIAIG